MHPHQAGVAVEGHVLEVGQPLDECLVLAVLPAVEAMAFVDSSSAASRRGWIAVFLKEVRQHVPRTIPWRASRWDELAATDHCEEQAGRPDAPLIGNNESSQAHL